MPFGQYKGRALSQLPGEYLYWLNSLDNLREPLRAAVKKEWRRRQSGASAPTPLAIRDLDADDQALLVELLRAGYRALAMKHHPDMGGSADIMIRLTRLMERLRGDLS